MATQRDVKYNLNVPGPSALQGAGRGTQIAESHGRLSLGQSNLLLQSRSFELSMPKYRFLERKLFVTISNAETTTLDRANKAMKPID
ncbi:hypothetical protein BGY98DRAFT_1182459 [Russula aff. rugulosa BPL654]|nr:hypothetical protein BGY98DRAFT_1182459 [Russula aff. rugulosa BPL654]